MRFLLLPEPVLQHKLSALKSRTSAFDAEGLADHCLAENGGIAVGVEVQDQETVLRG